VSLREGEISELGLQASLSYPDIMARSGLVIIVILFARRGLAWHDATVPATVALLAVREQVAAPRSSVAFVGCDADGLDPGL
jgi:hypothetical protein